MLEMGRLESISFLYVCIVNTIFLFIFVETPRKFIIAELSIRKLGSSSVLIILDFQYILFEDCPLYNKQKNTWILGNTFISRVEHDISLVRTPSV